MQPVQCDINVYRGDDFELMVRLRAGFWDGTQWVPGVYMDLDGWMGKAQIRASEDAAAVLAEFAVEILPQSGDTLGGVRLTLADTVTKNLATAGVWDLQFTDVDDRVNTYLKGKVTISKDVTRT